MKKNMTPRYVASCLIQFYTLRKEGWSHMGQ